MLDSFVEPPIPLGRCRAVYFIVHHFLQLRFRRVLLTTILVSLIQAFRKKTNYVLCLLLTSHRPSRQITLPIVCIQQTAHEISQGKTQLFLKVLLDLLLQLTVDYWASLFRAKLPRCICLISSSCSSTPCYVIGFLQIPPRDGHPCLDSSFRSPRRTADFHRLDKSRAYARDRCAMLGAPHDRSILSRLCFVYFKSDNLHWVFFKK